VITVRFVNDPGPHATFGSLVVLFEGVFEIIPRVEEFVIDKTTAVYQITSIIHILNEDGMAKVFATTRLVRAAEQHGTPDL